MSSRAFYAAQQGHIVPVIYPANITGGGTGVAFSMKTYAHASIVIVLGAQAAAETKILVNACTAQNGTGATAIPYDLYTCETTATDVLSARTPQLAAGYTPSGTASIMYVIELDAAQLPQGSPYVQLQITNGANADFCSAIAILSDARYASDQSATVLA
jgi:hypothetical protein